MKDQFFTYEDSKNNLPKFLELIDENPNDAMAYQGAAQCYYGIKDYVQATVLCNKAISIQPNLAIPHVILAYINYDLGKNTESIKEAEKAYQLSPDLTIVLNCYGTVLLSLVLLSLAETRIDDAISLLESAIQRDPELLSAHNNLAVAYWKKGDYKRSLEETKQVFRLKSSFKNFGKLLSAYQRRYAILITVVGLITMIIGIKIKALLLLPTLFVLQGWWIGIQYFGNRKFKDAVIYAIAYLILAGMLYVIYIL